MADTVASIILRLRDEASAKLKDVAEASKLADADLQKLADQAGGAVATGFERSGQAAAKLAGAVELLDPELARGARGLADLADVGEVAASALKAVGLPMSSLLTVALPVTAAVGAFALALHYASEELAAAEAAMKSAADAAENFEAAHSKLTKVSDDVATSWKLATGQISELEVAYQRSDATIQAGYADQIQLQAEAVKAHEAELKLLREKIQISQDNGGGSRAVHQDMVAQEAALTAQLEGQRRALEGMTNQRDVDIGLARGALAIKDAEVKAAEAARVAADAAAEAERNRAKAVAERAAAEAKADAEWKASDGYAAAMYDMSDALQTGMAGATSGAVWQKQIFDDYIAAAEAAAEATVDLSAEAAAAMGAVATEMERVAREMEATARARQQAIASGINTASAIGGSLASGDIGGILTTLGPTIGTAVAGPVGAAVGSAVADGINALVGLGNNGADAALANVDTFMQGATASIEELPALIEGLQDRSDDLIPQITAGVANAAPQIMWALTEASLMWPVWFVKGMIEGLGSWWGEMGGLSGILSAAGGYLRGWWSEAWSEVKSWASDLIRPGRQDGDGPVQKVGDKLESWWNGIWNGSFDVGSDVMRRDGLALVHAGERIDRANGTTGGRGAVLGASSSSPINVIVQSVLSPSGRQLEDTIAEFQRQLGERAGFSLGNG